MKSIIRVKILVASFVIFYSGCSGPAINRMNETMKTWEGHHYSHLIERWGPPTQVLDDGAGGKIYCYQSSISYTTPGSSYTTGNTNVLGSMAYYRGNTVHIPPQTRQYDRFRMFWVNPDGYIYKWSWQGL